MTLLIGRDLIMHFSGLKIVDKIHDFTKDIIIYLGIDSGFLIKFFEQTLEKEIFFSTGKKYSENISKYYITLIYTKKIYKLCE